ncbi:hypothetical protein TREMEDRAFT_62475 [Tremella mesenterica DSM 1558]|uniref:uncharacterized protein n=1 Tax=Tremella mesenterica (strain ATCC 24925 / CBS 8224 / DSM 1558 / NBRC 9311 / NRRL Y-6157 / RJB 2259-6 / UBC 559-6) TaxID=578456 RepID=UPI0003F499E7|nr:uncharacterized protein TREMEDRAFT_62475 [Tremella mesenterica DSM 1558]EIW69607.1 hypothetical protein TREMEDRAFT_62475 [Tremella mesenterica DSM 1558]
MSKSSDVILRLRPHLVKPESSLPEQEGSTAVAPATPSSATRRTAALLLRLNNRVVDSADDEEDEIEEDEIEEESAIEDEVEQNQVEEDGQEVPEEEETMGYLTPYVASAKSKRVAVGDRVEISPSSVTVSNGTVVVSHGSTVTRFHDVRVQVSPYMSRGQLDPELLLAEVDVEDRCDGCRNIQTKFLPATMKMMSCMTPLFVAPDETIHIGGNAENHLSVSSVHVSGIPSSWGDPSVNGGQWEYLPFSAGGDGVERINENGVMHTPKG